MQEIVEIKKQLELEKETLFSKEEFMVDSFKLCINYSLLIEEYIFKVISNIKIDFILAAAGSFSRRELSPNSDIDLMIITDNLEKEKKNIENCKSMLWNIGIKISYTVRKFSDIEKFLEKDLTSFTQFFETRFLYGDKKLYKKWNQEIAAVLDDAHKKRLLNQYFVDLNKRHIKYGNSPKVLEPNVKSSAGGLRDFHTIEWIYSIKNNRVISSQEEITQTELFLEEMEKENFIDNKAVKRLLKSYKIILLVRNLLHLFSQRRLDRFEFPMQKKIALFLGYTEANWKEFMFEYFNATNIVYRFAKTLVKKYQEEISGTVSEFLSIDLDDDFHIKDNIIYANSDRKILISEAMRAFYYRGLHGARFSQSLRSIIINCALEAEEDEQYYLSSSVFFREILKLSNNVGDTLSIMNGLGVLGVFLPEFKDLIGFFQPGVYHHYTTDEHTLIGVKNLEALKNKESSLSQLFDSIKIKDTLYLSVLLHDIAKPISMVGHEIIGSEMVETIMELLGYGVNDIELVKFLVKNHLIMEQFAFRRNLNDPETLDGFVSVFSNKIELKYLYLLTYADLSAISPIVWTNWKSDLLEELYTKSLAMLNEKLTGEELMYETALSMMGEPNMANHESNKSHVESINMVSYLQLFSHEEINEHIAEIKSGKDISILFKNEKDITNITVIAKDSDLLLSKLCGVLTISDLNIHDAKIFTRKDGIVIDNFNVSVYRTNEVVPENKYEEIKKNILDAISNEIQIVEEIKKMKTRWWQIDNKLFKRKDKIIIDYEDYDKYTIIDVHAPDRVGMLYQITSKMDELGLVVYFSKIASKGDTVVDSFYVLDRNGKKIADSDRDLITLELTVGIDKIL